MGKRWTDQQLQNLGPHEVYPVARQLIREWLLEGYPVGRSNFDPNAVNHTIAGYIGVSNKQLKMVAKLLLRREPTPDEAWNLFVQSAL